MKTIKSFEDSRLLMKSVAQTVENETKEQRDEFPGMMLDAWDASLGSLH